MNPARATLQPLPRKANHVLLPLLACCLIIASVPIALAGRDGIEDSAALEDAGRRPTVRAAGRGGPYLNLRDGYALTVDYRGEPELTAALEAGAARARSLAAADFDGNGTPDVVAGYALDGRGLVTLQRGNPEAFAPTDESVFVRLQRGYDPDSLLRGVEVYPVPVPPDFLVTGSFTRDPAKDVLLAARGGGLYLMAGDGRGGLGPPLEVDLPGAVAALAAGEFRAADGFTDVAVGVTGPAGDELLIFDAALGLSRALARLPLAEPASAIELGGLDEDPFLDVAVATGSEVLVLHGWSRREQVAPSSRVERFQLDQELRGLALGEFTWDREGRSELAALTEDGTVHVVSHQRSDARPFAEVERAERNRGRWRPTATRIRDVESVPSWQPDTAAGWTRSRTFATGALADVSSESGKPLLRTHLSARETDDLVVVSGVRRQLEIVGEIGPQDVVTGRVLAAGTLSRAALDVESAPVAVLPLPQKLNGVSDVVVLTSGQANATLVPRGPVVTITVDRTDDTLAAAAIVCDNIGNNNNCSLRGAIQFANANPGTTINLPAGTYALTINGTSAGGCDGNTVGDLGANQSMSIVGAGAATTIIRQEGTGPANDGDRVMCMNEGFLLNLVYSFSGVSFVGGRDGTAAGAGTALGGGGIIGGEKGNVLTLTNAVLANNQVTVLGSANIGGGGIQITGGDLNIVNSTIGGTSAPGAYADRASTTTANLQAGSGGGVMFTPSAPMNMASTGVLTVTGSTFSRNTAGSISAGGGGADLLIFAFAAPGGGGTGSATIGTSTFSNNQANPGNGGGILVESLATTVATTTLSNNSAGNRGGGIFVGGASLLLDGTSPSIVFSGNTATNGGSSVSTSSAVNVAGTNTTIGGDIEVNTLGSWTNNAGSTLAPTNVVVTGGTFNCNDSVMNVGGNLTIGPGPVVGSTFNGNNGTVNIAGNFTLTAGGAPATSLSAGTSTFNFNGTGAQSISNGAAITLHNLTDSNTTQPLTLNNSLGVGGTLNVNGANAILAPVAAAVVSGAGTLTGTGTVRVTRTAATPDFLSQYTITTKTLTNLTVDYSGAGNQTVNNAPAYRHLRISGTDTKTLQGNTTVSGNVNLAAATLAGSTFNLNVGGNWTNGSVFSPGTGTVTFAGTSGTQLLTGNTTFFNLTLNNAGATTGFATTTTVIGNDLTATAGTMDGGASTLVFTGVTDNQGAIGGVGAKNFHNLQINSPATISNVAGGNLTIEGNYTNGGTFTQGSGLTTIFALDNGADGNHSLGGAGATTFGSVDVNAANTLDAAGHSFNVAGSSFAVGGTFNGNGNTVSFNGGLAQSINGNGAKTFSGLLINNASGVSLTNGTGAVDAVAGLLTLTTDLAVAPGAILQQTGTSAGTGDVVGTVRRADLGAIARAFGNPDNTIAIDTGTPPTQLDFNLAKFAPVTFPAGVKVVPRTATLTPTGGSGISATVKLRYLDPAELAGPGITESRLILWKNIGGVWTPQGGVLDAAGNFVSLSGVGSSSDWAIAEGSDLTLTKSNDVGGAVVVGQAWNWTLSAANSGAPASFADGQTIFSDTLPSSGLTYGAPAIQNVSNVSGSANLDCNITSNDLVCAASGGSVVFASDLGASSFDVVVSATPQSAGAYQNPRTGGSAEIDPDDVLAESDETNNSATANTVTVGTAVTTTAITSDSPDPSVVGEDVTVQWTVDVSAPGALGSALTGNVTVSDGTDMCVAAVSAGQCDLAFTSVGMRSLTATYSGDLNYGGSASSPPTSHTVQMAETTTTITADDHDPSAPGESVTVEWTVTVDAPGSGTPTGNVDVTVSGGAETCSTAATAGQCSLVLNALGARTITATYAGDANFGTSSDTEDHEVCTSALVTTIADDGAGSLRQVVADACDGDTIGFDAAGIFSTPQTILLTSGEVALDKNLTIDARPIQVTVSGNGASRVFHVGSGQIAGIIGLTIAGGSSAGDGGGVVNDGALTIVNSTLSGNAAATDGGAISTTATGTSLTLVNTTISGNAAAGNGGGVVALGGTTTSINTTIANNTADSGNGGSGGGGGIHVQAGTVTLRNTIVANNFNDDGGADVADDISGTVDATSSFNLIGTGGAGGLTDGVDGNQVGVADAGLEALADNGGVTRTHALSTTSPALEAGSDGNLPGDSLDLDGDADTAEALPVDQRGTGFPRVVDSEDPDMIATVDVGAFELLPVDTPTATPTPIADGTPTTTPTASATGTATPTPTTSPTGTSTPAGTPTGTATPTPTATPTMTGTITVTPTGTATPTASPTGTATATPTVTATATSTPSATATGTPVQTPTATATATPSPTPTPTETVTATASATSTTTATATATPDSSATATATPMESTTATSTSTATPTTAATVTLVGTATATATSSATVAASATSTPTSAGVASGGELYEIPTLSGFGAAALALLLLGLGVSLVARRR